MPIAPITGKLRKRFFIDISCALGLGLGAGYAYWFVLGSSRVFQYSPHVHRYGIHLKHSKPPHEDSVPSLSYLFHQLTLAFCP